MRELDEMIILVIERDLPVLARGLPCIHRFLNPKKTTIIAPKACLTRISELKIVGEEIVLLDEDEVVPGLNLEVVRSSIEARGGDPRRAGWYFKQFAILAYATRSDASRYYLNWDADTIPVRPMSFFDQDGRPVLAKKRGYNKAYFKTIESLVGIERRLNYSFIAENMLFEREIVRELIAAVLQGAIFEGRLFVEAILNAISDDDLPESGFSEYETYGTFVHARHPDRFAVRNLPSLRHGSYFFGRSPTEAQLFAVSTLFSWSSFEWWSRSTPLKKMANAAAKLAGAAWLLFAILVRRGGYRRFTRERDPHA